jgi:hypothetical protein
LSVYGARRVGHFASAAFAATALGTPSRAFAEGDGLDDKKTSSLSWTRLEGAETCVGTRDLAQRVEGLLGRAAIVSAARADLSIEGRVERHPPSGFRATIVVAKSSGEILGKRELASEKPDCRLLDEPVAIAMALMIDPDALSRPPATPAPAPAPREAPRVVVQERTVIVAVPADPPSKPEPTRLEGYASAAMGIGATPLAGGFLIGVTLDPPRFPLVEGNVSLLFSKASGAGAAGVRFAHFEAGAFVCPLASNRSLLQASLCAGGQAGFVSSTGTDLDYTKDHLEPQVNAAARGRFGIWTYPFAFTLGATLSVPLLRNTYVYGPAGGPKVTLFEALPVGGTFDLSIGLKFPEP